jgi:hypothetical protein
LKNESRKRGQPGDETTIQVRAPKTTTAETVATSRPRRSPGAGSNRDRRVE